MLNEGHVTMLWQNLFRGQEITPDTIKKAAKLLDELRPESPLRFRLETELEEIRTMQPGAPAKVSTKKVRAKPAGPTKPRVKRPKVTASVGEEEPTSESD
jgi:hypothetical protein